MHLISQLCDLLFCHHLYKDFESEDTHPTPPVTVKTLAQPFGCRHISILAENALLGLCPAIFLHKKMKIMS